MSSKIIKIGFIAFVFLQCYLSLSACSCVGGVSFVATALGYSHTVFVGKVIGIVPFTVIDSSLYYKMSEKARNSAIGQKYIQSSINIRTFKKVLFSFSRIFKGEKMGDTMAVITGMGGGDCGYIFEVGKEYIVYCDQEKQSLRGKTEVPAFLTTNICTRTQLKNEEEIAFLEKITAQGVRLTTEIIYDRYIIVKDTGEIRVEDLSRIPILPLKHSKDYSQDTLYIYFTGEFQADTVNIYRNSYDIGERESAVYSGIVKTDSITGLAGNVAISRDNELRFLMIEINGKYFVEVYLEQNLNFISIGYNRFRELLTIEMNNKAFDYQQVDTGTGR